MSDTRTVFLFAVETLTSGSLLSLSLDICDSRSTIFSFSCRSDSILHFQISWHSSPWRRPYIDFYIKYGILRAIRYLAII
eukprot:snap_masked-scaffold_57-processed-gene-0.47-mRNA-1 protein AED:1.00 eAED:1.00 QI:0/0/0/0/1/1/3/0/79